MNLCQGCNQMNRYRWCHFCNAKRFQQKFKNWTSGNEDIDRRIRDAQSLAACYEKVLEWIPYDRFYDIKYIAKGGFGTVYKANWIDGYIRNWDYKIRNWRREGQGRHVALKS